MNYISRRDFFKKTACAAAAGGFAASFLGACCKFGGCAPFKYGVCDWTIGKAGDPKNFALAKAMGLDGILLSSESYDYKGPFYTPAQIAEFKGLMASTGLEVCSTGPTAMNGKPFISADNAVEFTCKSMDAAAALGAHNIILPFYGNARLDDKNKKLREDAFKPLVERLKEVARYGEKIGVTVSLENSISAEDNLRVIEAVGSERVKVYLDIMNFEYYGFDTPDAIHKLKGNIGEIHIKDFGCRLDSKSGIPRDVDKCLQAILDIGYKGWLVFEVEGFKAEKFGTMEKVIVDNKAYVEAFFAKNM